MQWAFLASISKSLLCLAAFQLAENRLRTLSAHAEFQIPVAHFLRSVSAEHDCTLNPNNQLYSKARELLCSDLHRGKQRLADRLGVKTPASRRLPPVAAGQRKPEIRVGVAYGC